ncbi:MAG: PEP-CTERM sorting domain-containing protein [Fimbriimonadaceae bacterium]|nr:PEP-CTERM sorting domain-containing protein [Fimbriimonadaceae bacterium]
MRFLVFGSMLFAASSSWAQIVALNSYAYGNAPQIDIHGTQFATLADWAAANYYGESSARADGDAWDPPHTESFTTNSFLQDQAQDAVLRTRGLARQPYRGRYHNEVRVTSQIQLNYQLEVENLSGTDLDIVFGNTIHGVFGVQDEGYFVFQQRVDIPGIISGGEGRVQADTILGAIATGFFTNTLTPTTIQDPVYGNFSNNAFEMNSYQFYGHQIFAPHASATFDTHQNFEFIGDLGSTHSGLAVYDFSNTAHLTVKAYDPVTGADRSSEIRVRLTTVPEPTTLFAFGVPLLYLARRRRRAQLA